MPRRRPPTDPDTSKPRRGGKSGRARALEGADLAERKRLIGLALAKCHADRGSPVAGTPLVALADALGVHATRLSAFVSAPTLDKQLRRYIGAPDA